MRDFNSNKRFSKGRDFNNRGGSDRPQLYSATCANCGKACEVPFRPTGSKPVLCRDCFRNDNSSSDSRRFEPRNSGRSEDRRMYSAVCASCGNSCQVPFQPTEGRPVYCSACFDKNDGQDARPERRNNDRPSFENRSQPQQPDYKAQLDALNAKVDKILEILSSAMEEAESMEDVEEEVEEEAPIEEVTVTETVEEKPAKKSKADEEQKKEKKATKKKTASKK